MSDKIVRFPKPDPDKQKATQEEKAKARQDLLKGNITPEKYYQIVHRGREICLNCGQKHD